MKSKPEEKNSSIGLEEALLLLEQSNAELSLINSVQQGIVAEMELQAIYDLVGDKIRDLFNAQVVGIYSIDSEKKMEYFNYLFEDGERIWPKPRPLDKIRTLLVETKEMILIDKDLPQKIAEISGAPAIAVPGTKLPKSILFVPMMVRGKVNGYLSLQNLDIEQAFSASEIRLLGTLTNTMSVSLENARLFNETEQRNAELAVINSVQEGLAAEMDMQGIYDLVGDRVRSLFNAQVVAMATFNFENNTEEFHYIFEDGERFAMESRPIDKIRQQIIDTNELLCINENADQVWTEITGEEPTVLPGTKLTKSALYVPMSVGNEVRGYVSLQNLDKENAFSDSDIRLLSTLANSMSVALENARLFNETEQRNAEFAVINSVQEGLVREMDMQAIYELVGKRICEVLNTQTLIIRTFNHTTGIENWEYAIENGEPLVSEPRPIIWANKELIKSKESWLINENFVETAQKFGDKNKGISTGLQPKSAIFVPMIVSDTVMGSVSLQNVEKEKAFTESDVRLLSTITNSMSVALENARLFNETTRLLAETEQRATELQTVNNISKAMVSKLDFNALIKLVGEQMHETFKADIVYLALHDRKTDMLHFPYIFGETAESRPFANGITEKIILKQEPLLINQKVDEAYSKIKAEVRGIMVQSFLGVPIIAGSKAIGVVSVQSTEAENRFNEYDQRLLTTIAANLGIAIQNAEAYQKLQEALSELKSAQQQLIQSEKMASLGELTAGIAHEIQNPLNFVNNFSEVNLELIDEMLEELIAGNNEEAIAISKDIKDNQGKINHHGKRADGIVKGMLHHSRSSNNIKEPTNINALADEYLRLAYHGLRAKDKSFNANLVTDFDDSMGKINVIPQDIGRVLLNLITNAFYATNERKKDSTDLENDSSDYEPTVSIRTKYHSYSEDGSEVIISVKDNGNGIPNKVLDKIFQPFFTTKPTGSGTGLGLSLSYDIVKAHGGELKVETKEGEGTAFTISLPINTII